MPRTWYGRRIPDQPADHGALTAAAVTVAVNNPPSHVLWGGAQWQAELFQHYDTNPELHKACAIFGYAFSQAKMIAVDVDPTTLEESDEATTDPVALALVARLFDGPTGRAQAQRQMGIHLTGPGDCWVLASDQLPDADAQPWRVLSVGEVTKAGNTIRVQNLDGTQRTLIDGELLFRLFNPHPRIAWQADSPNRALLPVYREIAGLSAHVIASIKSRLASAGVWFLPKSASAEATIDEFGNKVPGGAEGWMNRLADAMLAAIAHPEDASAVVPIVSIIPDEMLAQIKDPIRFVQDIMTDIQPLREAARERVAGGQDMPPEMLLGMGDTNHWGQWFIDESFVKGPLAALLALPADAFTTHYLRPGLQIAGRNPRLFAVKFDTRHMIPEAQEENAKAAYQTGLLSRAAYLTALGFDPIRDAASPEEQAQRLILEVLARGNPQTLQELEPTIKRLFPGINLALPTAPVVTTNPAAAAQLDPAKPAAPVTAPTPSTTVTHSPPAGPPSGSPS